MPTLRIESFDWETRTEYEIDTEYDVTDFNDATGFLRWDLNKTASPAFKETCMREWTQSRGNFEIRNGTSSSGIRFRYVP
jgi:hypothetical protein